MNHTKYLNHIDDTNGYKTCTQRPTTTTTTNTNAMTDSVRGEGAGAEPSIRRTKVLKK